MRTNTQDQDGGLSAIVVIGYPELAAALRSTAEFEQVLEAADLIELQDVVGQVIGTGPTHIACLFALDPGDYGRMLQRYGYRVVACAGAGAALSYPTSLNAALAALSEVPGVAHMLPRLDGETVLGRSPAGKPPPAPAHLESATQRQVVDDPPPADGPAGQDDENLGDGPADGGEWWEQPIPDVERPLPPLPPAGAVTSLDEHDGPPVGLTGIPPDHPLAAILNGARSDDEEATGEPPLGYSSPFAGLLGEGATPPPPPGGSPLDSLLAPDEEETASDHAVSSEGGSFLDQLLHEQSASLDDIDRALDDDPGAARVGLPWIRRRRESDEDLPAPPAPGFSHEEVSGPFAPSPPRSHVEVPEKARRMGIEPGPHLAYEPQPPRIVAFTTPKGGTGKTSMTLYGAHYFGRALAPLGKSVVIVDGNFHQANIASYIRDAAHRRIETRDSHRTIADLIGNEITRESVEAVVTRRTGDNHAVLLGPRSFDEDEAISLEQAVPLYREVVSVLAQSYDYVFIDMPPATLSLDPDPMFDDFMFPLANYLVLVMPPLIPVITETGRWLTLLNRVRGLRGQSFPLLRIGAFLNGETPAIKCDAALAQGLMKGSCTWLTSIPRLDDISNAINEGEFPESPELDACFAEMLYRVTGEEILLNDLAEVPGTPGTGRRMLSRRH